MGESYGRKKMHGVIKTKGINVGETKIGKLLGEINPEAQTKRQDFAGRSLNPKVYNAKYFSDKIRYDQNEKLEMFRVVHVCTHVCTHCSCLLRFSFTRMMFFGFLKYFEVFYSLFRNSLRFNVKTSQLVFYNGRVFTDNYCRTNFK